MKKSLLKKSLVKYHASFIIRIEQEFKVWKLFQLEENVMQIKDQLYDAQLYKELGAKVKALDKPRDRTFSDYNIETNTIIDTSMVNSPSKIFSQIILEESLVI